jgi:FemAB-related protein (PEP-CTERM system-associated)
MCAVRLYRYIDQCESLVALEKYEKSKSGWRVTQSRYWCDIVARCLGHRSYYITVWEHENLVGVLPLVNIRSFMGNFLISMPYVNWGGIYACDVSASRCLIQVTLQLSEELDVDYLELRGAGLGEDSGFGKRIGHKVLMIRELPRSEEQLWKQLNSKVRNQVRKAHKMQLFVRIGGEELIRPFYNVYAVNMRHLGTPVYPLGFVEAMWHYFRDRMEIVLVLRERQVLAGGVLLHGNGISEIPLAASLPDARDTCANMLLYWHLMVNSIKHGSHICDFGRCTPGSGSYRFKKQWGTYEQPLTWYYYARRKEPSQWAKEHPRFQSLIKWWQRLPLPLTKWLGPWLVRGIPV